MLYDPNAVALDENGKPLRLFLYDGVSSLERARLQMKIWQENYGFTLLYSWINDQTGMIEHKCHVNPIGQIERV